jgi:hypothetical protein
MKKYLAFVLLILLASCKTKAVLAEGKASTSLSADKIIESYDNNKIDFSTLYIKASARYEDEKQAQNVQAEIRIKKDEKILISVRVLGITMAKALITPSAVKYYDKIGNKYFEGDFSTLSKWIGTDLDYQKLQNMFLGKAASFGVEPWYWYFIQLFEQAIPPYSLLLLIGFFALLYKQPKNIITWSSFMFLIGHLLVAHKELRFLFPLSYFVPFMVLTGISVVQSISTSNSYQNVVNFFGKAFLVINPILLLIICIKPANEIGSLYSQLSSIKIEKTILYQDKNPYRLTPQEASFYMNNKLNILQVDSFLTQTNSSTSDTVLFYSEDLNFKSIGELQVVGTAWTNTPDWLRKLNFNNWLDRRNNYTLYLVTKNKYK